MIKIIMGFIKRVREAIKRNRAEYEKQYWLDDVELSGYVSHLALTPRYEVPNYRDSDLKKAWLKGWDKYNKYE